MENLLTISDLNFSYGEVPALRNVNLEVPRGCITCLMGRNGVGKTTLVRTVTGHLAPRSGSIRLADSELGGIKAHERARLGLGYVPQGRMIFPRLTVEENLLVALNGLGSARPGRDPEAPIWRAGTARRELPQEIFAMFPILKEFLRRRGGDLSGGQQQQLAIARALITKPDLLILDEPTEGIQPSIIKQIGTVLMQLVEERGMTVLMVEQYVDFVKEIGHHFALMNRGAVVASGRTAELGEDLIREYLHV